MIQPTSQTIETSSQLLNLRQLSYETGCHITFLSNSKMIWGGVHSNWGQKRMEAMKNSTQFTE